MIMSKCSPSCGVGVGLGLASSIADSLDLGLGLAILKHKSNSLAFKKMSKSSFTTLNQTMNSCKNVQNQDQKLPSLIIIRVIAALVIEKAE